VQEGGKPGGELVISGSNSSELLESSKETFDEVPILVLSPVNRPRIFPLRQWGNDCFRSQRLNSGHNRCGVVAFVGGNALDRAVRLGRNVVNERLSLYTVVYVPSGQFQGREIAEAFYGNVYLGRQSTTRAADGLRTVFFEHHSHAGAPER